MRHICLLILTLILLSPVTNGQGFIDLDTTLTTAGDSLFSRIKITRDLQGNGLLSLELESSDSTKLDKNEFRGLFWMKFMDGSLFLINRDEASPLRDISSSIFHKKYSRTYTFPLGQLEQKKFKEVPLKYFFQRNITEGKFQSDTLHARDPWLLLTPQYKGLKYWQD